METLTPAGANAPVGVFDSGIGGLSVLREIRALLPHEDLLYFADSGHAPYGGKSEAQIVERAQAVAAFLLQQGVKAMVVACNTATAAAIDGIRKKYPALPVVGVEPGLKPGAFATQCGKVGVLATKSTVSSQRFETLRAQVHAATGVQFVSMPCPGLADKIEEGELDTPSTAQLVRSYVQPLLAEGVDTLVLGCTHYPFVLPLIERECAGKSITIIDTGHAVARQLARLLDQHGLHRGAPSTGRITAYTTGPEAQLASSLRQLLGLECEVEQAVEQKA
jgi:glutamate racemase